MVVIQRLQSWAMMAKQDSVLLTPVFCQTDWIQTELLGGRGSAPAACGREDVAAVGQQQSDRSAVVLLRPYPPRLDCLGVRVYQEAEAHKELGELARGSVVARAVGLWKVLGK